MKNRLALVIDNQLPIDNNHQDLIRPILQKLEQIQGAGGEYEWQV